MADEGHICNIDTFNQLVNRSGKTLVVVKSPRCSVCRYYDGVLAKAGQEGVGEDIALLRVNIGAEKGCRELLSHLNVKGVPAVIYFKDGEEVKRFHATGDMERDLERLKGLK